MNRPYSLPTLSRLYSLNEKQVIDLIESESVYSFDPRISKTVLYIPTLNAHMFVDGLNVLPHDAVDASLFKIIEEDDITTVEVLSATRVPVSSFLYSPEGEKALRKDGHNALIVNGSRRLYIAPQDLISRLSKGVSGEFVTITFDELKGS